MWTPWKRSPPPILLLVGLMGIVSAYAKTTCYDLQQAFFTTCTDCIGGGAIVRETPVDLCGPGFGWNASAAQCDADVAATTLPTCGDLSDLWDATGCCELATRSTCGVVAGIGRHRALHVLGAPVDLAVGILTAFTEPGRTF